MEGRRILMRMRKKEGNRRVERGSEVQGTNEGRSHSRIEIDVQRVRTELASRPIREYTFLGATVLSGSGGPARLQEGRQVTGPRWDSKFHKLQSGSKQ